jgi:hypothetical protein
MSVIENNMSVKKVVEDSLKISFCYESIHDIQSTIRALDQKLFFVWAILSLSIAGFGMFSERFSNALFATRLDLSSFTILISLSIWFAAFIVTLRGVIGISNPSKYLGSNNTAQTFNLFYLGGLFNWTLLDVIMNRRKTASKTHQDLIAEISNVDSIIEILSFEQMKLAYIRDVKMMR